MTPRAPVACGPPAGHRRAAPRHPRAEPRACGTLGVLAVLLLSPTAAAQVLRPAGPAAERIGDLWWLMLAIATIVCVVVIALFFLAVRRRRDGREAPLGSATFVVLGGIVVPLAILVPLMIHTLSLTESVTELDEDALVIEVEGHQWWWEVRYPEYGIVTANELHVPAGEPVRVLLTSDDVIHSFWVPALTGKMDLVPGQTNTLRLEASEAGVHYGQCAEFCGAQHANMQFLVVAQPRPTFEAWAATRGRDAAPPEDPLRARGREVFLEAPCASCHTIRGTPAAGTIGPDLTHVGSRHTLGAGTLPNTRGSLGGWIANSQAIKPGNEMPPMILPSPDLLALIAYLEGLE